MLACRVGDGSSVATVDAHQVGSLWEQLEVFVEVEIDNVKQTAADLAELGLSNKEMTLKSGACVEMTVIDMEPALEETVIDMSCADEAQAIEHGACQSVDANADVAREN